MHRLLLLEYGLAQRKHSTMQKGCGSDGVCGLRVLQDRRGAHYTWLLHSPVAAKGEAEQQTDAL